MALYESEHTRWMREWMDQHPEERLAQRTGRALWWDKPPCDEEEQRRFAEARVPQKAYYFDVN
ncbi:MAG: DUF3460 family protein [Rhodocyclaceae bacterium]|nr:DUF3460 family protein [Rhodocyclaceae bacterium]MBK7815996.1 DUF3460 family protein [Rhodocyclaceae bacterium]